MTHNNIAYYQAKVNEAANLETARSNRVKEAISDYEAKSNDAYRKGMLVINEITARETARHNANLEALQARQNEIQAEHNERIAAIQTRQNEIAEQRMRNDAQYNSNIITLRAAEVAETRRSNQAREEETRRYNTGNLQIGATNSFWTGFKAVTAVPAAIIGSVVTLSTLKKGATNE